MYVSTSRGVITSGRGNELYDHAPTHALIQQETRASIGVCVCTLCELFVYNAV